MGAVVTEDTFDWHLFINGKREELEVNWRGNPMIRVLGYSKYKRNLIKSKLQREMMLKTLRVQNIKDEDNGNKGGNQVYATGAVNVRGDVMSK